MSSLSTVEARLPPGFRFHPRDDELICEYLIKWVNGCPHIFPTLIEVDLNKCEPWEIPENACVGGKDWYFYSQRDRKYATGLRTNRATVSGYWKATGKDRPIARKGTLVGMRKTLVFYQGRAPKGRKTDWVMHEFRIDGPGPNATPLVKADWVLCRVFFKTRAETNPSISETGNGSHMAPCTPSLPPLMEPYITFEQTEEASAASEDHEQVPCFSIFNPLTFSHMDPPPTTKTLSSMPNLGDGYSTSIKDPPHCVDHKAIKAVLNHLTRMENYSQPSNNVMMMMMKGPGSSPSLGEGNSDCSYLSEVGGLSSVWNHYS